MLHRALAGIRVLDLSRILAGPWCTQNLADLGADVVKVEHPERGDDTRGWGPPYMVGEHAAEDGSDARMSAYFISCNRGKRSVAIDYGKPEGAARLLELARDADVLVENYKAGTLKRYGLDYVSLKAVNPRLIYLSITGFGQDGPMADKPGYDYVFQGMGGLMSYTGQPDGTPGAGPLRTGVAVVDVSTGMYATSAVLAALYQRQHTGEGQHLDIALLDVAVALNANQGANYLVSGNNPQRSGNAHPNCAPYEVFRCADGHLILAIGNDAQFARFCDVAGRGDLMADPRYLTNSGRIENIVALRAVLTDVFPARTREEWTRAFDAAGVPWGPINTMEEVFAHPQVRHRQMQQTARHPVMGAIPMVRNPMLPANPNPLQPPPLLGEHTHSV
ncbi:CaiB/BaiF CoA transferase family protein [Cupriavidus plantarum]|uniref:CaiB/BaiF CoA transferase family protein n=1 Tax=Cupriavidus plantarum TaxID=942865 RepID=UPI000E27025B|nr:CoA transferase [Cupriavidus plantarum]REE93498.1 formyl-CoA transferase [Cupriavidus plantarum]RLK38920.1 formyl-CoA transferase [Cupriavidus plantarum]